MRIDILSLDVSDSLGKNIYFREGDYLSQSYAEIMQSTGLKDKLGKEIYEGDMIKTDADIQAKQEVFYRDGSYSILAANSMIYPIGTLKSLEIVGNIYEDNYDK